MVAWCGVGSMAGPGGVSGGVGRDTLTSVHHGVVPASTTWRELHIMAMPRVQWVCMLVMLGCSGITSCCDVGGYSRMPAEPCSK